MTSLTELVLVVLVVVSRLDEVDSLQCLDCNSTSVDDNCSSTNGTCNGTVCRRFTGLLNGEANITILDCGSVNASGSTGCSSDVYTDPYGQQFSGRSCYCNSTDFCANIDVVIQSTTTSAAAAEASSMPSSVTQNNTLTVFSSVRPPPGLPWGWLSGPFGVGPAIFTCYKCSSRQDAYCGTHLDKSGYTVTCTGGACLTYSGKVDGSSVTSRDCAQNVPPGDRDCITKSEDWSGYKFDGTFCLCRSDYCNEFIRPSLSTSLHGNSRLLLLIAVVYITTVCSAALTSPSSL